MSTPVVTSSEPLVGQQQVQQVQQEQSHRVTPMRSALPLSAVEDPQPGGTLGAFLASETGRRTTNAMMWTSAFFIIIMTVCIVFNMIRHPMWNLLRHSPLLGLFCNLLFFTSLAVSLFCALRVYVTAPGPIPGFMTAGKVTAYVREVVRDTCAREIGPDFESDEVMAQLTVDSFTGGGGVVNAGGLSGSHASTVLVPMDGNRGDASREADGRYVEDEEGVRVNAVVAQFSQRFTSSMGTNEHGLGAKDTAAQSGEDSSDEERDDHGEAGDGSSGDAEATIPGAAEAAVAARSRAEKVRREKAERKAARRAERFLKEERDKAARDEVAEERDRKRCMARRRRARLRHGLAVYSLGRVALEAHLRLRDGGPTEQSEVVSFLLGRAPLCTVCGYYSVSAIRHCDHCGQCSRGQDQHCFVFGACLARDNHKYMILFLLYCAIAEAVALVASIVTLAKGYDYFFTLTDMHLGFYISFCFLFSSLLTMVAVAGVQVFQIVGRGQTTHMLILRDAEHQRAMARLSEGGGQYSLMATEAPLPEEPKFQWSNMKAVFGEDPRVWTWLMPTMAPQWQTPAEDERAFRTLVRETVEKQLLSAAHTTREDEESAPAAAMTAAPNTNAATIRNFESGHEMSAMNGGGGSGMISVGVVDDHGGVGNAHGSDGIIAANAAALVDELTNPAAVAASAARGIGFLSSYATGTDATAAAAAAAIAAVNGDGGYTTQTQAQVQQASALSTADNPVSPPLRPAIQRIPFFAKRTLANTSTASSSTATAAATTTSGSMLPLPLPSLGTAAAAAATARQGVDPFELYNQPTEAVLIGKAASSTAAGATATAGPPVASSEVPSAAATARAVPDVAAFTATTAPSTTASAPPSAPEPGTGSKKPAYRAKMD